MDWLAMAKSRIIRYDNEAYYELSHDDLATKIAEDRDPDEVAYLELVKRVKTSYN